METAIYDIIILIFIPIGAIALLCISHIRSKAWSALSLDSRKKITAASVEYSAQPDIRKKTGIVKASRFIAIIALGLSWVCFTSNTVILFLGNLIFVVAMIVEIYLNAYTTKVARKKVPHILSDKQSKLVWKLYVISHISFIIGFSAGTLLVYYMFS
ncbi:hypothetical protein [Lactobacillus panisapium]|uniref:hypothetical protein n=1 Tax=Lactobacillus panisapium TaxID=2012495 RepID=UPI0022E2A960|nr:hypothetical protein [Lactobacillus panisapium]